MKKLVQQSYRTQYYLPQPNYSISVDSQLLNLSFSWGEVNPFEQMNNTIQSYYSSSKNDLESTSPFEKIISLSPFANVIRTSMLLANDQVYRNYNKKSYSAGVELSCIAINGQELIIAQVGNPCIVLIRKNKNILLSTTLSLSIINESIISQELGPSPLPLHLLGVENVCYPNILSVNYQQGDVLFFISAQRVPENLLSLSLNESLPVLTHNISNFMNQEPFWIGRIEL